MHKSLPCYRAKYLISSCKKYKKFAIENILLRYSNKNGFNCCLLAKDELVVDLPIDIIKFKVNSKFN